MRSWVDGNMKRFWRTALAEVMEDRPEIEQDIEDWEAMSPGDFTLPDFYCEYVWAVYNAGFKIEVLETLWDRISEALYGFDVEQVSANLCLIKRLGATLIIK